MIKIEKYNGIVIRLIMLCKEFKVLSIRKLHEQCPELIIKEVENDL